ncbi:MAG: Stage V sporulation protein e [Parcubacteria group bacterium GW2011_GWC2_39_14]|nr:MAG: Stage V sporulation protein e [Parcubacteria group bacterium GW2011_GWC2_39_14]
MLSSAGAVVGFQRFGQADYFLRQQLFSFAVGCAVMYVMAIVDYHFWRRFAFFLLIISIGLLVAVFLPGLGFEAGGARRWINLGSFLLQPSEIIKLTFLLYLAVWLEKRGKGAHDFTYGLLPFLFLLGIIVLLIMMQPDLGTVSIIVLVSIVVYFLAGAPWRHLLIILGGGAVAFEDIQSFAVARGGSHVALRRDPGIDAEIRRRHYALPVERIEKMKGLKALCLTTSSFSWIDGKKLAERGIILTNTPGKSTNAVAEFNMYMMMTLLRKIPLIAKNNWEMDYDNFINDEAKGKTAGIIGLGQIGSRVAELCAGLGLKVYYWDRKTKEVDYERLELADLLKKADVIFNTLATPTEVKGIITDEMIKNMKQTALIVSTSDPIYNSELILQQVAENKLGGFAFESDSRKFTDFKGNVMVFPEQAYLTKETLANTSRITTETVLSVIKGTPINKVN